MNEENQGEGGQAPEEVEWRAFLERVPPHQVRRIPKIAEMKTADTSYTLATPSIRIWCDSENCGGLRFFDAIPSHAGVYGTEWKLEFLRYSCRHCRGKHKIFAVVFRGKPTDAEAYKLGEDPPFGPNIPTKMFSLLGEDQQIFHKGRRSESQGMGIGAFAYYRRVVENQKNRLIDEIIQVSRVLNASSQVIQNLEAARKETQFKRAIEIIKDGIPEVLRIHGHNPLTLLHGALSEGLHEHNDEECLARAETIRVVLAELAERITDALKENKELNQAVSKLLQFQQGTGKPKTPTTPQKTT